MPVRLRDVADKLNLSPSLVSGVLNSRAGVWASDETRRRIFATARELGYRPNAAARALRSGKTSIVALIYINAHPEQPDTGLDQVAETLANFLSILGYRLLIYVRPDQEQLLAALRDMVLAQTCDVVLLWGDESDVEEQATLLEEHEMPFVVKGRHEREHPLWPQADFDHEGMMAAAVEHLAGYGHRSIAYLGFPIHHVYSSRLVEGYRDAMRRLLGHEVPDIYISDAAATSSSVEARMAAWLALEDALRPTAVVSGAGINAWVGVERALARTGRRLGYEPGDFGMAGSTLWSLSLLFGEARHCQYVGLGQLARALAERLLEPLLAGCQILEPIVRIMPAIGPNEGQNLLEFVSFRCVASRTCSH